MSPECIKIHGTVIRPAIVNGGPDVFKSPQFTLVKAEWEPDENKRQCDLCSIKFTQLKRRHHCRMCGFVRCGKCCDERLPLPQLGLEEVERVCDSCKAVTVLVIKSRSYQNPLLIDAASGLALFARRDENMIKLLELGGLQSLVALSLSDQKEVLKNVAAGLHSLSTHPSLHKMLAEAGGIKALCKILSTTAGNDNQISADGIGALMIFSKTDAYKTKVLDAGALSPVLELCLSKDEAISLLSISTLGLLAEHSSTHNAIMGENQNTVSMLFNLCTSNDEQIIEVALKTLALLSTGDQKHRYRIVQEDLNSNHSILQVLNGNPNNPQILSNASCLVANLAVHEDNQGSLHVYIQAVTNKLANVDANTELCGHLTRAMANFAQHRQNADKLITAIPHIVNKSLRLSNGQIKFQSMKFLTSLLTYQTSQVVSTLQRDGSDAFLTNLGKIPDLLNAIQTTLANESPNTVKPS